MSITLPTDPAPRMVTPRLITARSEIRPAFGGSIQRRERMGSRWAFDFVLPPMSAALNLDWINLLAEADTCIMNIPEIGITVGSPGTPLVNGAGQSGSSLIVDGLTPGYTVAKGKRISFTVSGLIYSYQTTAAVTADGSGNATLAIRPMLRASPADNTAIDINPAKVEGYATVPDGGFSIGMNRLAEGLGFTIEERK